jgi:hypothetical protein
MSCVHAKFQTPLFSLFTFFTFFAVVVMPTFLFFSHRETLHSFGLKNHRIRDRAADVEGLPDVPGHRCKRKGQVVITS